MERMEITNAHLHSHMLVGNVAVWTLNIILLKGMLNG